MTTGPWKPVHLESYTMRIVDVDIRSNVSEKLDVKLSACFSISGLDSPSAPATVSVSFTLKSPDGSILKSSDGINLDKLGCAKATWEWSAGELKLWYPVRYGEQPLYTAEVVLLDDVRAFCRLRVSADFIPHPKQGDVLDKKIERIAFRRVRIVEEKLIDQEGFTFLFEINNIRIFCGGRSFFDLIYV